MSLFQSVLNRLIVRVGARVERAAAKLIDESADVVGEIAEQTIEDFEKQTRQSLDRARTHRRDE